MGLIAWLFDKDIRRYEKKIDRALATAEHTAGRVIRDAERAAKGVVDDAQQTAARTVEDAERRIIRAYVIAFCAVVGAGLVHFLLVRSQVRALNAADEEYENRLARSQHDKRLEEARLQVAPFVRNATEEGLQAAPAPINRESPTDGSMSRTSDRKR